MKIVIVSGGMATGKTFYVMHHVRVPYFTIDPNNLPPIKGIGHVLGDKDLIFEEVTASNFAKVVSWLSCIYKVFANVYITTQNPDVAIRMHRLFSSEASCDREVFHIKPLGALYE